MRYRGARNCRESRRRRGTRWFRRMNGETSGGEKRPQEKKKGSID
jgi:hypothetical protein